ncbi:DUF5667 domain-containing protein [Streptomyces sp. UNOC14_S4]|uniref:DUF5667 domain-containing protein n=1 Tax=Streptomyces sp. UNOC14_S4 TaxID=2872340 RepID=UPI001E3D123C|nr:DUF5667 domain-containing protein [Streptomyces sp. UNOC14_S4]MCC3768081.1 hypothetical protein [Streptomyces sp. UNOC14_S4]
MIANVSAHRRANAFAQALEEQELQGSAATQPDPPADTAERGRLLSLAGGLRALPTPELDPETKSVQRAQLIAAMESQFAGGATAAVPEPRGSRARGRGTHRALSRLRPRSRWSKGLAAGGLTVGVAAGAFGGVAAASSTALPGDTLYGLKRGMEDIKLGLADGDSARGGLFLDQASTRLHEARRLMERGRSGSLDSESLSEIRRTLSGMQHDVSEGHRLLSAAYKRDGSLGPMERLDSFASLHREGWSQLRDKLPAQLADVGERVSSLFVAIDNEVGPLRSLLPPSEGKHAAAPRAGASPRGGDSRQERPAAPPSASSPGSDSKRAGGGQQHPSDPGGGQQHEGLLGGTGLLQPPQDPSNPAGPAHGKEGKDAKQPEVIVPPLLPGILPGLGLHSEPEK